MNAAQLQIVKPIFVPTQADFPLVRPTFVQKNTTAKPYSVIVLNGKSYVPLTWDIDNNAHGATGSATVTLDIGSNPDFTQELFRGDSPLVPSDTSGIAITDNTPVYIQIYAGFPSSLASETDTSQLVLLWYGTVDQYSAMFHADRVTFACRSFAAPLVANRITRISMSETSVAFLQYEATRIGMNFVPILPPGYSPITIQQVLGQEFIGGANFASALYGKRIWDLGIQCAMFDNVDLWVDKDTVYYAATNLIPRQTIALSYGRDIEVDGGLTGTHSPQFSKNVQVELHTYQPRTRMSRSVHIASTPDGGYSVTPQSREVTSQPIFGTPDLVTTATSGDGTVTVTTTSSTGGAFSSKTGIASESGKERYIYFVPNQNQAALNNLGQSIWRSISQHEYAIDFEIAVTPELLAQLNITSKVKLSDVPYRYFNDVYFSRTMRLRMSPLEGLRASFQAVNHLLPQGAV